MWVRYLTISFSKVYLQERVNAAQRGDGLPITTFLFEEHESMPGDVFKTGLKMLGPSHGSGLPRDCCGTGGTGMCTTGLACSGRSRTNGTPGTCETPSPVDGGSRDVPFSE